MRGKVFQNPALVQSAFSAVFAVFCGLILWGTSLGDPWIDASYDYLFRFGSRAVTNQVTLILMDNGAFAHFEQNRGEPWDRALHAQLLNRLADDGCPLVVSDSFFHSLRDPATDASLAAAMARQKNMVLMAEQAKVAHPDLAGAQPVLPAAIFLQATHTNWGVAWLDPDLDGIVRRHWPFPSPGPYPSLAESAARVAGKPVDGKNQERWLRYYSPAGSWTTLSYQFALTQPKGFFKDQIVFIGTQPRTTLPDQEPDEFLTPFYRWNGESSGGVQIMATLFLNLMNDDWLRRVPAGTELLILASSGMLFGFLFGWLKPLVAGLAAVTMAILVSIGAITESFYSDYWFCWLIISGAQIPCALGASWGIRYLLARKAASAKAGKVLQIPVTPGYKLVQPAIGQGAYGKVWLARAKTGEWKALKAVYLANFDRNQEPFEREYNGVTKYLPICRRHPGLLTVEHVSEKKDGYFYYVMDLADSITPGWQKNPTVYRPHDLVAERTSRPDKRLSVRESIDIAITLAETMEFLHQQGFTHRDIKPQNIIFVGGQPKLADLGLITEIRPGQDSRTIVGTPGFMPPPPETPGTPQADVFGLGMVIYVMATGREASAFPDIPTCLLSDGNPRDFMLLNSIIIKACQPNIEARHQSARELLEALKAAKSKLASPEIENR